MAVCFFLVFFFFFYQILLHFQFWLRDFENSYRNRLKHCFFNIVGMSQGTDMMLLSETRQQNTEVRLSLSKMSDKMDHVIQKVIAFLMFHH
jgi:hypothetical protein